MIEVYKIMNIMVKVERMGSVLLVQDTKAQRHSMILISYMFWANITYLYLYRMFEHVCMNNICIMQNQLVEFIGTRSQVYP